MSDQVFFFLAGAAAGFLVRHSIPQLLAVLCPTCKGSGDSPCGPVCHWCAKRKADGLPPDPRSATCRSCAGHGFRFWRARAFWQDFIR